MRPSSETIYLLLFDTSVAIYGVAAVWAAVSRRHWFFRATVIGAILLAVLLLPAHRLFVTYAWLSIVVLSGLALQRWRDAPSNDKPAARQLSLTSIFLLMLIAAVASSIAPGFSFLSVRSWIDDSRDGMLAGGLCLLSVWLVYSKKSWLFRLGCGIAGLLLLTSARVGFWYVVHHFTSQAFIDQDLVLARAWWPYWFRSMGYALAGLWLVLTLGRTSGWLRLDSDVRGGEDRFGPTAERRAKIALTLICVVMAVFPLFMFFKMLFPPAIPLAAPPVPNAYDQLVEIGMLVNIPQGPHPKSGSLHELRTFVTQVEFPLRRLPTALASACLVPVEYQDQIEPRRWDDIGKLTTALFRKINLAVWESDSTQAADNFLFLVAVGEKLGRGANRQVFDLASASMRQIQFPELVGTLNGKDARRVVQTLAQLEKDTELLEDIEQRQYAWEARAFGWQGRGNQIIDQLSGEDQIQAIQFGFRYQFRRAIMRIWILAAAVRSHWHERGGLPTDVQQLVPEYLAGVPDNPFDEVRKIEYTKLGDASFSVSCVPSLSPDAGLPMTPILLTFDFGVVNAPPVNAVREK